MISSHYLSGHRVTAKWNTVAAEYLKIAAKNGIENQLWKCFLDCFGLSTDTAGSYYQFRDTVPSSKEYRKQRWRHLILNMD